MSNHIGVVVVNLGTPESAEVKDIRRFLREFLSDRRVIRLNPVLWKLILYAFILPFRPKKLKEAYQSIWLKEGAPLLVYTQSLTLKLSGFFKKSDLVFKTGMTYGQPALKDVLHELTAAGIKKILVLPLYPQYSTTTTLSVIDIVEDFKSQTQGQVSIALINDFHNDEGFIQLLADNVAAMWRERGQAQKLLMSFHGIPKAYVDDSEPYVEQCHATAALIAEKLNLSKDQWDLAFQSRFGKQEWVKPYTDALIEEYPANGINSVDVICPGFFIDCLETVEEIAQENKQLFLDHGGERFNYITAPNDTDAAAAVLANLIKKELKLTD